MGLTRFENWPVLLFSAIEERCDSTFTWGDFDCCCFAAECVEAITGVNLMHGISYTTEVQAKAILENNDGLEIMVTERLGNSMNVLMAQRGDVVMRHDAPTQMLSLGVCVGDKVVFPALHGVAYVNLADCICCWRV